MTSILRQHSGGMAPIFGITALALAITVGVSVDSGRAVSARSVLQQAQDAATLAASVTYDKTLGTVDQKKSAAQTRATEYLVSNLAAMNGRIDSPTITLSYPKLGAIASVATGKVENTFTNLLGMKWTNIQTKSEVETGAGVNIEIVLMLDNSASMLDTDRITKMREAAKDFVQRMFDTHSAERVKVSVVPWANTVNINIEDIGAVNDAAFAGVTSPNMQGTMLVPKSPFEDRAKWVTNPWTGGTFANQAAVDAFFAPVGWRGCIMVGPGERKVNSAGVSSVPITDEMHTSKTWPALHLPPKMYYKTKDTWVPTGCFGFCGYWRKDNVPDCSQPIYPGSNAYMPATQACGTSGSSTVKACVSDSNEFAFLAGVPKTGTDNVSCPAATYSTYMPFTTTSKAYYQAGPNVVCPTSILPLSSNRKQVIEKLDQMFPVQGGTHVDIGLLWGLRTISPRAEWASFFGYSNAEKPGTWTDKGIKKMGILLTDGRNESPTILEGYYGCTMSGRSTGHPDSKNCWSSPDVPGLDAQSLDQFMDETCTAMKSTYALELYTIAVDISDQPAIGRLRKCATSDSHFFNITSNKLDETFAAIAKTPLRVSK